MSTTRRLLLGLLSFLPIVLFIVYLIVFFSFFISICGHVHEEDVLPALLAERIAGLVAAIILLAVCSLFLLVYFIVHSINNRAIDSTERIVWVLIFIFAGMIGFPVYWYMRIWKTPLPSV